MSKRLKEIVKKIQYEKDWTIEEVADSIGYSRVHLTREQTKKEKSDLEELLIAKHADLFQNETNGTVIRVAGKTEEEVIGEIEERLIKLDATITVLTVTVAESVAKQIGKPIASVSVELLRAIDDEVDRLYAALGKKKKA